MATLVIETATAACSVAVLDGARVVAERHEVVGRGHAERLVPMIGAVLAEAGLTRADAILVDCGPGSFTGIRVGLAAARALALAWGVEAAGYGALALIAAGVAAPMAAGLMPASAATADGATMAVAIGGGHGELFVQRYAAAPLRALDAVRSLTPDAAARALPDHDVIGSAAEALVAIRGFGRAIARLPVAAEARLLPPALAALPPVPLYGRAPDAALPR